jgi:hypothetical protein
MFLGRVVAGFQPRFIPEGRSDGWRSSDSSSSKAQMALSGRTHVLGTASQSRSGAPPGSASPDGRRLLMCWDSVTGGSRRRPDSAARGSEPSSPKPRRNAQFCSRSLGNPSRAPLGNPLGYPCWVGAGPAIQYSRHLRRGSMGAELNEGRWAERPGQTAAPMNVPRGTRRGPRDNRGSCGPPPLLGSQTHG